MTRAKGGIGASADNSAFAEAVLEATDRLSRAWRAPELRATVTVKISPRLRTSLGRAALATGRVSIHPVLATAPPEVLQEVLCHEIAHVLAYQRAVAVARKRPAAHGAEWAGLVRAAGYEPFVRAPRAWVAQLPPLASPVSPRRSVLHVCPVCQARRGARRAVPAWRCSACVAIGLDGRMEVIRLPEAASHE